MDFQPIIAARRDGRGNSQEELRFLANGAGDGSIPDYQLAAWLMAAYLRPLNPEETAWLTLGMAESGERIDLTGLPKPWVDKHSTGGVGDKTSLVLLPLLAACGLTVVKMSGRGLGITGGTVDKLSSVPGFRLDLSPEEMKSQAARIGVALTGQSPNLAPADKTLYSLRDVTETVGSIPLIVSSILSKKIAGGAETIVLDVKCGSGAFMKTFPAARDLAAALVDTAQRCGLNIRIAITDMSQPLGSAVGNALEVSEALQILDRSVSLSSSSLRFRELCLDLAAHTLVAAKLETKHEDARATAESALVSGEARDKAIQWFEAQGAKNPFGKEFQLPASPIRREVTASREGWVRSIDAETVGQAVIDLGGGRRTKSDVIDLSVGVELHVPVGGQVAKGDPILTVHAKTEDAATVAAGVIEKVVQISELPVEPPATILAEL